MKIAITGKSGRVGRQFPVDTIGLVTRLEADTNDMASELKSHPQIECMIHLAAIMIVADCEKNPQKAYEVNVEGALKWFKAAALSGVKHFIFTSTSHVYGNPKTQEPIPTSWPLNPISVYGKTKAEAEVKLLELSYQYPETKLTIVRMFSLLSKDSNPAQLYSNLYRRAREKDFSSVPGLYSVRDFLPVEIAARRIQQLASWKDAPKVVHICSGKGRSVLDLATEVFAEFGLDAKNLLKEGEKSSADIPYLVGVPTAFPNLT